MSHSLSSAPASSFRNWENFPGPEVLRGCHIEGLQPPSIPCSITISRKMKTGLKSNGMAVILMVRRTEGRLRFGKTASASLIGLIPGKLLVVPLLFLPSSLTPPVAVSLSPLENKRLPTCPLLFLFYYYCEHLFPYRFSLSCSIEDQFPYR